MTEALPQSTSLTIEQPPVSAQVQNRPAALCSICKLQAAKYTCPRCSLKSCSLPCSTSHKETSGCSGVRNKAEYVPMNAYGYGTLMNDYVFLEEVGRHAQDWGRRIAKDGIARGSVPRGSIRGTRMRGGRGRGGFTGQKMDRRAFLSMQLGFRDIDMDVLPLGMDRAKRNQSHWDSKTKTAYLTVELIFHPLPNPLSSQQAKLGPVMILAQKNNWNKTLRCLIHEQVRTTAKHDKGGNVLELLESLIGVYAEDDTIVEPLVIMKRPRLQDDAGSLHSNRMTYYHIDWNKKLSDSLRGRHFVEFPCFEVINANTFTGVLVDDEGIMSSYTERKHKRRRVDAVTSKKAMTEIIGGYGSDGDDEPAMITKLGEYSDPESDVVEPEQTEDPVDGNEDNEENYIAWDRSNELDEVQTMHDEINDDELDWGDADEEIAEDEARLASMDAAIRRTPTQ